MLTKRVHRSWLEAKMHAALLGTGMQAAHRHHVVDGILFAALRGVDTHGVPLLRTYLRELESGRAKVHPQFKYEQRCSSVARLDADGALGIVAASEATHKTATLAKEHGVGVVVVANSNHFGAASIFTTKLASAGLVGLAMTNSDALVVPTAGRLPRLGTNPISLAAQGERDGFCTDFATSQGSFLRSLEQRAEGRPIPSGVLVDEMGHDVAATGGAPAALLPLGGHKGQCLGMMVSILCALLGNSPFDWQIPNLFEGPFNEPRQISHFILAIDISAVTDAKVFRRRLSEYLRAFDDTPAISNEAVTWPGAHEDKTARARSLEGIPIKSDDYDFLLQFEADRGVLEASESRE